MPIRQEYNLQPDCCDLSFLLGLNYLWISHVIHNSHQKWRMFEDNHCLCWDYVIRYILNITKNKEKSLGHYCETQFSLLVRVPSVKMRWRTLASLWWRRRRRRVSGAKPKQWGEAAPFCHWICHWVGRDQSHHLSDLRLNVSEVMAGFPRTPPHHCCSVSVLGVMCSGETADAVIGAKAAELLFCS